MGGGWKFKLQHKDHARRHQPQSRALPPVTHSLLWKTAGHVNDKILKGLNDPIHREKLFSGSLNAFNNKLLYKIGKYLHGNPNGDAE